MALLVLYALPMKKVSKKAIVVLLLVFPVFCAISEGEKPDETVLSLKNQEIERLEQKVTELNGELGAASIKVVELGTYRGEKKLEDLERKALEYDALSIKTEIKDFRIGSLTAALEKANLKIAEQKELIDSLSKQTNELAQAFVKLESEQVPLKEALRLIRLGKYEYYEVQEGDTCDSIAAKDVIYGDQSKSTLIRQANRGNVDDLDNLVAGQMLVIPRFDLDGAYEF